MGSQTEDGESPVSESGVNMIVSRVVRDTGNPVWKMGDHPQRLNTTWWPIVKKYREGKLKRTPGGEWNRTWNPMFTSRQSDLRRDVVLFVERSGELFYMARLSTKRYEAEEKSSLKRANKVIWNRPETEWPNHGQAEAWVESSGGPNS